MNSGLPNLEERDTPPENHGSKGVSLPPIHFQPDDLRDLEELLLKFDDLDEFRVEVDRGRLNWSGNVEEFLNDHNVRFADFGFRALGEERSVRVHTVRSDTTPNDRLNLTVDGFPTKQRETVEEDIKEFVKERSDGPRSTSGSVVRWGPVPALPGGLLLGSSVGGIDMLPPTNPGNVLLALFIGYVVGFFLASVLNLYHPWAAIYPDGSASNRPTLTGRVKNDVVRVATAVREVSPVDFVLRGEHPKVNLVGFVFRFRRSADITPFAAVMFALSALSVWLTLRSDAVHLVLNLCGIGA